MTPAINQFRCGNRDRGIVLIISLIMLMMLTILGVVALRSATTEERIASNLRERQLTFEYAESGLRQCQDTVRNGTFSGTPTARPTGSDSNAWSTASAWDVGNPAMVTYSSSGAEVTVQCMVDAVLLEPSVNDRKGGALTESRLGYRATVRAFRSSVGTMVMVQSIFPSL